MPVSGAPPTGQTVAALPWVFTQSKPLDTDDVIREAKRRGVVLDERILRALYLSGELQPLLEVQSRRTLALDRQGRDEPGPSGTRAAQLQSARRDGRLVDPACLPVRPRLQFAQRSRHHPEWWNGLLYSRWQLLALPHLAERLGQARTVGPLAARRVTLPALGPGDEATTTRLRQMALALTGLEARYLPTLDPEWVQLTSRDVAGWDRYRDRVSAQQLSTQLRCSAEQARADAEWLLFDAHRLDPMGDWSRLVRRAPQSKWENLNGDALVAMEYRVAAEILLLFVDDLAAGGLAEPVPQHGGMAWGPLAERLSYRPDQLNEVLQDLGVSPHPRVVLALEGDTETRLVPRVFKALGLRLTTDLIQLVNMGSDNKDLSVFAAFAAAPLIAARRGGLYHLARPPTRLLIAVDAHPRWSTPEEVERKRATLVQTIRKVLEAQDPPVRVHEDDLNELVRIRTWQTSCFEYAHFSDPELVRGLRAVHPTCNGRSDEHLADALRRHRAANQDIGHVWSNWRPTPSKIRLAEALWPDLETRIVAASSGDGDLPEIAAVVIEAYQLAQQHPGEKVDLRAAPDTIR